MTCRGFVRAQALHGLEKADKNAPLLLRRDPSYAHKGFQKLRNSADGSWQGQANLSLPKSIGT